MDIGDDGEDHYCGGASPTNYQFFCYMLPCDDLEDWEGYQAHREADGLVKVADRHQRFSTRSCWRRNPRFRCLGGPEEIGEGLWGVSELRWASWSIYSPRTSVTTSLAAMAEMTWGCKFQVLGLGFLPRGGSRRGFDIKAHMRWHYSYAELNRHGSSVHRRHGTRRCREWRS
jgi:hypothetical protein